MDTGKLVLLWAVQYSVLPEPGAQTTTHIISVVERYCLYPEFWSWLKLICIASYKLSSCKFGDFSSTNIWHSILPERRKKMDEDGFTLFYHLEFQNKYFMQEIQKIGHAVIFIHPLFLVGRESNEERDFVFFRRHLKTLLTSGSNTASKPPLAFQTWLLLSSSFSLFLLCACPSSLGTHSLFLYPSSSFLYLLSQIL